MKVRRIICMILAFLLLSACGAVQPEENQPDPTLESDSSMLPKDRSYSILFIGNSYTFYNDMPTAYFQQMAEACGYDVEITTITKGAYTLEKFSDTMDMYGMRVHTALSEKNAFDYVILQEQSLRPAIDPEAFYAATRLLNEKIRAAGAQPILYSTWGRKAGNTDLAKYDLTNVTMTQKLATAYDYIGEELDIPVMHVGLAFYDVYTGGKIDLYDPDLTHPSAAGSYLAAMVLFSGIFGADPTPIPFESSFLAQEDAVLRAAAKRALEAPLIPES